MQIPSCLFFTNAIFLTACVRIDMEFTNNSVEHPGHCYSMKAGVGAMNKGEYKTLPGCVRAICDDDTNIYYDGCGKWKLPPTCQLSFQDLSKPYPDCCPFIDCS